MAEVSIGGETSPAEPTRHYNSVVEAWSHLLGEDLHYGFFQCEDPMCGSQCRSNPNIWERRSLSHIDLTGDVIVKHQIVPKMTQKRLNLP